MKTLIAVFLGLLLVSAVRAAEAEKWATLKFGAGLSIEHPATWRSEEEDGAIHVSPKGESVHVYLSVFELPGATLQDFAEVKFTADENFTSRGPAREVEGPGWTGLIEEADDSRLTRKEDTRRVVLCAARGSLFISVSLYLDPKEYEARMSRYSRLMASLKAK